MTDSRGQWQGLLMTLIYQAPALSTGAVSKLVSQAQGLPAWEDLSAGAFSAQRRGRDGLHARARARAGGGGGGVLLLDAGQ